MKTRILVVDDNVGLVGLIEEYFMDNDKIDVVHKAFDGVEAIDKLNNNIDEIDVILLDLVMPKKDGICVLEYMKANNINKKVIVMTSYNEEQTIRDVGSYGVRYYALKPFDLEDLEHKILLMMNDKSTNDKILDLGSKDMQLVITKLLHSLGIPSHIKGYQFIRTAILLVYENPDYIGGITKDLYPDISEKFDTSVARVERAIRHAIEISWLREILTLWKKFLGIVWILIGLNLQIQNLL